MKFFNYIKIAALGLILSAAASCGPKEVLRSSVLPEETNLTFAAVNAPEQTMSVFAEGDWVANVSVDWLTVSPMYGTGNTVVTISVTDNVKDGAQDSPRQTAIYFTCDSKERGGQTNVYQKGDTYLGLPEISVSEIGEYADEDLLKIPNSTVMALTTTGMVLSDGTSNLLVTGVGEGVKVGDKVFVNGQKATTNGFPGFILDECEILSNGTPEYPTAKNISSEMGTYTSDTYEYVSVAGSIVGLNQDGLLIGAAVRVPGQTVRMMVATSPAEMAMVEANYHKVEISGYYTGKSGSNLSFIPAVVNVGDLDESVVPVPAEPGTVLFQDNFDWMDPFIAEAAAAGVAIGRSVEENNASGAAPNLYTTAGLENLRAEFEKRYVDINAAQTSLYPQNTYWKFGKTSVHTGIQLPSIDYYGELELGFDWSPHMTGSGNIDKVILIVEVITAGTAVQVAEYPYDTWEKGKLAWKHVTCRINITPESQVIVRPISLEDYNGITQQRWYIDNIKVGVPGPDVEPIYANVTVDQDILTYEGEGGDVTLKVSSDYDFAVATDAEWLTVSPAEGAANEEVAVKVTAAASELSTLREAKVIITSEETVREIRVIQSAAGQDLDPFVAISKNAVDVNAKEQTISVNVQATHEYSVTPDVSWITIAPETKATVIKESVTLLVAENTDLNADRVGHVVFAIDGKGVESVLTVTQAAAEPENPNLLVLEDFQWMQEYFPAYEAAAAKKVGDTIGEQNASANSPQIYAAEFPDAMRSAFAARGWSDLNAGGKMVYINDAYLKLSKTGGNNTAVQFDLSQYMPGQTDLLVSFDFAMQIQGSGTVDAGPVVMQIIGDGKFSNGTKISDQFVSTQKTGELFWNNVKDVRIIGASENTKIVFINGRVFNEDGSYNWSVSGAGRFFLDNIKIEKTEPKLPLDAVWAFTTDTMADYADLFGGTAGVVSQDAGWGVLADGSRMHVPSTIKKGGEIYYYQVDKTSYTPTSGNPKRIIGGTGDPYITGGWPGDYWLITATDGQEYPAGTKLNVNFLTRVSATGHKYMLAEYWDGAEWKPAYEVKTESVTGKNAEYNFEQSNVNQEINVTWTLAAPCTEMQFRLTTVANWQQGEGKGALANPNGGTCRLSERCELKVVEE